MTEVASHRSSIPPQGPTISNSSSPAPNSPRRSSTKSTSPPAQIKSSGSGTRETEALQRSSTTMSASHRYADGVAPEINIDGARNNQKQKQEKERGERDVGGDKKGENVDDDETPKATTGQQPLPAVVQRPPIRPPIPSISKSKFDLEPNPFEQSFSRSSTSIQTYHPSSSNSSQEDVNHGRKGGAGGDRGDRGRPSGDTASKASTPGQGDKSTSTALPPLSALTSPAPLDPNSHFSWSGLSSSLRAGPLSPAMLAGPAAHSNHSHGPSSLSHGMGLSPSAGVVGPGAFDPSSFRTGFTPGSGFTPGYGIGLDGPGFPLPSPNTAAFLSMVTNSTPSGQDPTTTSNVSNTHHVSASGHPIPPHMAHASGGGPSQNPGQHPTVDITPNTLKALTGVINQMEGHGSGHGRFGSPNGYGSGGLNGGPQPPQIPNYSAYQGHGGTGPLGGTPSNGHLHPQMLQQSQQGVHPPLLPHVVPSGFPPAHIHGPGGNQDGRSGSQNPQDKAVNGLFLLSQAHQEISKREEQEMRGPPAPSTGKRRASATGGGAKSKRKAEDAGKPAPAAKPSKKAKKNANAPQAQAVLPPPPIPSNPFDGSNIAKVDVNSRPPSLMASPNFSHDDFDEDLDDEMMDDMGGEPRRGKNGKPETEEEKRKNFLERNRQAALKCRQRKKAWLNQLQTRVDGLTAENERLKNIVSNLTDEVGRVSTVLGQHRDCPGMAQSLAQVGLVPPMPNGGPYGVGIVPPQPPAPPRMIGTMSRD